MPRVPPTTAIDADAGKSPCCDADLVLRSPPHGYECRECTKPFDLIGDAVEEVEVETCDEVMGNGEVCGRETPCQYH